MLCAGLLICAGMLVLLLELLLLELDVLLLLELALLLAAVVSVGCTWDALGKLSGCIFFFAFPHCLCLSLFRCSSPIWRTNKCPTTTRRFWDGACMKTQEKGVTAHNQTGPV